MKKPKEELIDLIKVWEVGKPDKNGTRVAIKPILIYANGLPIFLDKDLALERCFITEQQLKDYEKTK